MSQMQALAEEIARRAGVDEDSAMKTLKAIGLDHRFEEILNKAGKPISMDDLRLSFKLGHATVAV